eukprot:2339715-Pyramimonas_sp.AAC.1
MVTGAGDGAAPGWRRTRSPTRWIDLPRAIRRRQGRWPPCRRGPIGRRRTTTCGTNPSASRSTPS